MINVSADADAVSDITHALIAAAMTIVLITLPSDFFRLRAP